MRSTTASTHDLPRINDLGRDLLTISRLRRWITIARPLVATVAATVLTEQGLWWAGVPLVAMAYAGFVAALHDAIHRSLGLSRRAHLVWQTVLGSFIHPCAAASAATHTAHHRNFPGHDDPESDFIEHGAWHTFWVGFIYGCRETIWTWQRRPDQRRAVVRDLTIRHALIIVCALIGFWTWAPFIVLTQLAAWMVTFPLLAVWLVHRPFETNAIRATHTAKGWMAPLMSLGLYYHLEHHLYPGVPSANAPELAVRLRPHLVNATDAIGLRIPGRVFD